VELGRKEANEEEIITTVIFPRKEGIEEKGRGPSFVLKKKQDSLFCHWKHPLLWEGGMLVEGEVPSLLRRGEKKESENLG